MTLMATELDARIARNIKFDLDAQNKIGKDSLGAQKRVLPRSDTADDRTVLDTVGCAATGLLPPAERPVK